MVYGLDHLSYAAKYRGPETWYFDRVDEWQSKRNAIAVLLEDLPTLVDAEKKVTKNPHPANPDMWTFDPRPSIRLVVACEAIANALYSSAEIAANFANLASKGLIPSSFNEIRKKCEGEPAPPYAGDLGDLQWYRKVRELRTEWAHYSTIFVAEDESGEPMLCVKSFRRRNDRREFAEKQTVCRVHELCGWVERANATLEAFAGHLLTRYVIPLFHPEQPVTWMVRDDLGFPKLRPDGTFHSEHITYREYLARGEIRI